MRACEHIMSSGPVMAAMRSWPSSIRCRVAISPPDQFADPTDGTSGEGSPAGSMITNGMARDRSIARYSGGRSEKTSTTPTGRRRSTPSTQSGAGECLLPLSVSTTLIPFSEAMFSTPRMISIDQAASSSWKTSSMSRVLVPCPDPRRR